ncbi:putative membrane-bound dehydrogenase domain-containing protein [Fodinibius roseus]|uniref:Putative membrane-bound dehydrogenase domain-containing protein n=1 Tax=Fodinibius roseus TaxID=1194090 RepID=A0A1M5AX41_9BACT|nr:PVC-type heme-binding CxxCH protein [Fodinibius roseus]SHF34773.1 putative membrane-bound dehydrogenase domain-containing protein [Fodinibius roseus]
MKHSFFQAIHACLFPLLLVAVMGACSNSDRPKASLEKEAHLVLLGNNLGSRMMNFGHFETEMHLRYPDSLLYIRNMSDPGNTPGFRPHAARNSPWAFPGAEKFYDELAAEPSSEGHFPTPDAWLTKLEADIIIAFFGYNESFEGKKRLDTYKNELEAFIDHTRTQRYNGRNAPELVLVSPIAFEDLSDSLDLPDGRQINKNLSLYAEGMEEVAQKKEVPFVDLYNRTKEWFENGDRALTIDGAQLTEKGYKRLAGLLADEIFGAKEPEAQAYRKLVQNAVLEKNWMWENDYKIPNGVHAYGRRYEPYGPDNYPYEIEKIREMTAIRDTAIWQAAGGEQMDLQAADARTRKLPEVETNYRTDAYGHGNPEYLYGQEALDKFDMAPGYGIELFASEKQFNDLANPVQISFDNEGRAWVAIMPSYPHWKPGDGKPNDKLLIFEDTDEDGRADQQTTFADSLHLPVGFELAPEGVYVSQSSDLVLLKDTDGDDRADQRKVVLSGFDDHDTHHAHSAYTADPSGSIYMAEGVFLHTNVETSYGPVRATNGGFYRYNPARKRLERTAQISIPNPWGIAFDRWGQNFFAETSSPNVRWMMPSTIKPRYGEASPMTENLIPEEHMVRPTSGLEFVSSRHFPDEVQGDILINNTIGFLGTKQHQVIEKGTGYRTEHRQDLVQSSDQNFRPVDMEFAPDGSLYLVDWHNKLIGHMQHNARDPLRDHSHGRIYRITYPSRPLVEPAKIAGASIDQLLENLKLPEYRSRYRTRRELRGRDAEEVLVRLSKWTDDLDRDDPQYEHHLLEALWVTWGLNQVDESLLRELLEAGDHRVRAAAVRVLRYAGHQIENQPELLMTAARDEHGRVRLEAIVAASWLSEEEGLPILTEAGKKPLDRWMKEPYQAAVARVKGEPFESEEEEEKEKIETDLEGEARKLFIKGKAIYEQDGFCGTCHQPDGEGAAGFPPLAGTNWVVGHQDRLIKIVLKGLQGPIEVLGEQFPGQVPMTAFGGMLDDEEVAAVLTYVRNAFGNGASAVTPEKVREVRAAVEDKAGLYTPEELLNEHPMEK